MFLSLRFLIYKRGMTNYTAKPYAEMIELQLVGCPPFHFSCWLPHEGTWHFILSVVQWRIEFDPIACIKRGFPSCFLKEPLT